MTDTNFYLRDDLLATYRNKTPDWGYRDIYGTAVGEVVFLRTYSRMKDDGTKETWFDVCKRVIEGMFTLQKRHCIQNRLPWDELKAHIMAEDAFARMFQFKWTPPGRGLWSMGTPLVMEHNNSAALQNCAMVSTKVVDGDLSKPFRFLMEASMLGIGVGFDTEMAKSEVYIHEPHARDWTHVIPDTREGWVESVGMVLNAFFHGVSLPTFDYSQIRPAGEPIKTFGGTAAGPQPLIDLHNGLSEILSAKVGEKIDSRTVADIGNLIGVCVVSGNVRRSAELLLGDVYDEEFLALKDYEKNPERMSHGWMSNNSVRAERDTDLSGIVEGIVRNGEPGVVWMDTSREHGRLADPVNNKDWRAVGYNPCLTADSLLLTEDGWITFGEAAAEGLPKRIVVDGRVSYDADPDAEERPENWTISKAGHVPVTMDASEVFLTQKNAEIVKVSASNGMEVRLTPDHLIATKRGMVAAGDLIPGEDKMLVTRGHLPDKALDVPTAREDIDAVLMGLIAGDGTIVKRKVTDKAFIDLWGEDKTLAPWVERVVSDLFAEYGDVYVSGSNRPFTACNVEHHPDRDKVRISSSFLAAYLKGQYGFTRETKHVVPKVFLEKATGTAARQYVSALAFCDGTVNKNNKVGSSSARISQNDRKMLRDVQLICLANGITSSVYERRPAGMRSMPDGKGGSKEYLCKANYEIVFTANAYEFARHIGFMWGHKQELALETFTPSRKQNAYATVMSVMPDGVEDVYCLREPERRILCANGITMRRCAEQTLESYECCTLVETFMDRHDNMEDFLETLKVAYLYAKTVTLIPTHWPETNAVMQRNRRIGASVSGVTNFADKHGLPTLRSWLDAGYQAVQDRDKKYSEWLGVRESIKTTSTKPSGTVSLLSGSSPGAHWPVGGRHHIRRVTFSAEDPMVQPFRDAGYVVEDSIYSKGTVVVEFPVESRAIRSEKDVSAWEKATMAGELQRYWADNSVSVTVSFDPEEEAQHIAPILHWAAGNMKTISFLPMGNQAYGQMPYENLDSIGWEARLYSETFPVDLSAAYGGEAKDAEGESFCTTDACEIRSLT